MVHNAQRGLSAALDAICRVALFVSGIALIAMTVIVAYAVFGRFVLNDTPAWAESAALLLMGWMIMGAAAVGVREGFHMGFDTLKSVLPAAIGRIFDVISDLCITAFGIGMAWFTGELALEVADTTLPTIGLNGAVEYVPLMLGGVLITLFGIERLLAHAAGHLAPADQHPHPILTDA
ncbi:TRAP transporter small permease [Muricoccus pecuniae]|uniref:TRAP transporter small permease protein n=1 Tax=Muricoccus pecuniae TaxID=693023 RepID=A0A840Y0T9_9PROT|nr:TRAP transporter small permease [Roseomonas pecuniae]MBB5692429.1 TRAP-type C4-dicarboxylate transport system permease small subunit [Roseomonas pecuniae]